MKNYFVDAYLKTKRLENFWEDYLVKSRIYTPYLKDGKLNYKQKTIEPICSLKPHIFITHGR